MASEIIDSLVTQLEYDADTKVLDKADKKLKQLEKQSEKTAKATDELAGEQIKLKTSLQGTIEKEQKLRREQVKLRKEIKAAKKPTNEQVQGLKRVDRQLEETAQSSQRLRNELSRLGIQQAKMGRQQRSTQRQRTQLGGARKAAGQRAAAGGAGASGLAGVAAAAAPVVVALAAVTGAAVVAGAAINTVVETGARMETLRARLKTVEGGVAEAAQAFSLLRSIATETPFELEDVTNAYVRLKSLGIQPTEASLKAFGNVAAAQGKPIIDFIEAVADASTGEFERLKEFGIKASSQGEQVAFTMGGVTTKIGKNAKEITAFLQGMGETRFAGAMADQMNTFAGQVSNLKDRWTSFLDQISQLGVLDEVKAIVKELSGAMGDDLAPIIANVLIAVLRNLREFIEFLKGDSDSLADRMSALADTFLLVMRIVKRLVDVVKVLAVVFIPELIAIALVLRESWSAIIGVLNFVLDAGEALINLIGALIGMLEEFIVRIVKMIVPSETLVNTWDALSNTWATVANAGDKLAGTVSAITSALFDQAGSLQSVNNAVKEFQALTGAGGIEKKTDAELQEQRKKGGKDTEQADKEIRRRAKKRQESEEDISGLTLEQVREREKKKQVEAQIVKAREERPGKIAQRFDKLNDRQLAAFASDPNVSQKLRDKAEKEQVKRDKKRRTKGAAAGKKMAGATLIADINKQIDKNARELAQAETARGLRSGKLTAADAGSFETQRFKELRDKQKQQFEQSGRLPAGIAQDVRQIAALPSINDLAGRVAPPVISNTINNFEFTGNEIIAQVMGGEFATSAGQVAAIAAPELRKQLFKLLGQAVPNFRTQELR